MNIIMYGVHGSELDAIKDFEKKNNVQITMINEIFTKDTMNKVIGHDLLCIQQSQKVDDEAIYSFLKDNNIKQIALRTAGFDMIDLDLANKYNISITNVPAYSPNAIAEMALSHIMYLNREFYLTIPKVDNNNFTWNAKPAKEIRKQTIGIVGVGRIGYVLAKLLNGIGAKVIGYDINIEEHKKDILEYKDSLNDLLKESDIVSLHLPLDESTHNLINKDTLSLMKEDALLINTSRGPVVNSVALIEALENNVIKAAGLDTIDCEIGYFQNDYSNKEIENNELNKLLSMNNVLITPHIAFYSNEALKNMVDISLESALDIYHNNTSKNIVT
ncbi:MAG: D-2-hydroxyacid dehydrogenase [Erysipelotrichales bacterium]